jgi:hypothetical protein
MNRIDLQRLNCIIIHDFIVVHFYIDRFRVLGWVMYNPISKKVL